MARDSHNLHHFHKRKRVHEKLEPYPHPIKWKRILDYFIYVIGVVGPVMTIPQVYKIWFLKSAAGVSAISWLAYALCAAFWVVYGVAHKEKPIIFTHGLWFILDSSVFIGTMMYGTGLL